MDAIAEWTNAQHRVIELVQSLDTADTGRPVPACPDWTVTKLLAHMVGLNADVLAGDEPDDHNRTWTQRQVETRAGRDPAELVAEWLALTQPMQDWMRQHGDRPLNDVVIHEQDLRGAVGRPDVRPGPGADDPPDRGPAAAVGHRGRPGPVPADVRRAGAPPGPAAAGVNDRRDGRMSSARPRRDQRDIAL